MAHVGPAEALALSPQGSVGRGSPLFAEWGGPQGGKAAVIAVRVLSQGQTLAPVQEQ